MDTENEYLEAMNQLKEKFDKLEDKEKMIKGLIKKLRADMCVIYGITKGIDTTLIGGMEAPEAFFSCWELLATKVYDAANFHILGDPTFKTIEINLPSELFPDQVADPEMLIINS